MRHWPDTRRLTSDMHPGRYPDAISGDKMHIDTSPTSFAEVRESENNSGHLESSFRGYEHVSQNSKRILFADAFKIVATMIIICLTATCVNLYIKCSIMEAKQSHYGEKVAMLSRVTEKLLLDNGDDALLQEMKEVFASANAGESWLQKRSDVEDSNTPAIRKERNVQQNGVVPCPADIAGRVKRARKKGKRPKKPKKGTICIQGPPGPPGNCTCNITSIVEEVVHKVGTGRQVRSEQSPPSSPSIHMVGNNAGRIQMNGGDFFTWSHRYRKNGVDLAHNNMRQEGGRYIVITQSGYYYVYTQAMYSDGRLLSVGHETVVTRRTGTVTLMTSGVSEVGQSRGAVPADSVYHGGVFRLRSGDKLGVRTIWSGEWLVWDPTKCFFGAFLVQLDFDDGMASRYS